MKKIQYLILMSFLLLSGFSAEAQTKNFIDQPYLETRARVDTLVVPDRIYLGILISEEDSKGRKSLEEQEQQMARRLESIGIDLKKQLSVGDLSTDFERYFLRGQQVLKSKSFQLMVYDAPTAGQVIYQLEQIGIANVNLQRTEYSKIEELKLNLRSKAIAMAKRQGESMMEPLGQALGKALYISDMGSPFISRVQMAAPRMKMMAMAEADMAPQLEVDFQKISVEIQVQVNFAIQ